MRTWGYIDAQEEEEDDEEEQEESEAAPAKPIGKPDPSKS